MPGSIKKMLTVAVCLAAFGCFAVSVETAHAQAPTTEAATTKVKKAKKPKAEKAAVTDEQAAPKAPKAKKAKKAKEPKTAM